MLAGCARYAAEPLATGPHLAADVAALNDEFPDSAPALTSTSQLSIDQIGLLAILNDPDMASEFGQAEQARAARLTSLALPNPQLSFAAMALLSGPASTPSYAVSLSQDIASLITYKPRAAAARAQFGAVNAELLWQEWQVAQQARLLAVDIYGADQDIKIRSKMIVILNNELTDVHSAAEAGNLDLSDEAPLRVAAASAESDLAAARLSQLQSWQSLDALLGLEPSVRFSIIAPIAASPPADITPFLSGLPARRPDLVALQLGYDAADEDVRAAILAQFPALSIGPAFGSDTSNVHSLGPQMTIDLPVFDRNQGGVAGADATRDVLHAQYQAALDAAAGQVQSSPSIWPHAYYRNFPKRHPSCSPMPYRTKFEGTLHERCCRQENIFD